jgi:hypothetical protein
MDPQVAAEIAKGLVAALENPQETDSYRLSSLGYAVAALAAKTDQEAAAEIVRRSVQRLATALENSRETNGDRLSNLGYAVAALAAKMDPQAAAEIARRGVQRLAAALENSREMDWPPGCFERCRYAGVRPAYRRAGRSLVLVRPQPPESRASEGEYGCRHPP